MDVREGVSADMVLASLIGLLPGHMADEVLAKVAMTAEASGTRFYSSVVEEGGEKGLALTYVPRMDFPGTVSHRDAFATLESMGKRLGSDGDVASRILTRIFEAESLAHGAPPEQVHLHEVGRPEALLNIAAIGLVAPMVRTPGEDVLCSTVTTGRGITVTSHGTMRVPAPATAFLLRGMVHTHGDHPGERATPTGVAALAVLATGHSDDVPATPRARGVGFGTKRFAGRLGRVVATRV